MTATFKTVSPGVLQMTIGASYLKMWLKNTPGWPIIIGYYDARGNFSSQGFSLSGDRKIEGQFNSADGAFTWVIQPGSWQITGTPTGGTGNTQKGTF